eukprot:15351260-Ditylum_brightwellii.AAC.1
MVIDDSGNLEIDLIQSSASLGSMSTITKEPDSCSVKESRSADIEIERRDNNNKEPDYKTISASTTETRESAAIWQYDKLLSNLPS